VGGSGGDGEDGGGGGGGHAKKKATSAAAASAGAAAAGAAAALRSKFAAVRFTGRGLHSFTLELNLSNSRIHSGFSWVTRKTEELKLS